MSPLNVMRMLLCLAVAVLSVWVLVTGHSAAVPFLMLALGALMLTIGLADLRERKAMGYVAVITAVFLFIVAFVGSSWM